MSGGEALYDPEPEFAVLAACIESRHVRDEARKVLTAGDFYQPDCERLWDVMSKLDRDGVVVDAYTLRSSVPATSGVARLIVHLIGMPVTAVNVSEYAGTVRSLATKRRLLTEATRIQQVVQTSEEGGHTIAAEMATRFARIRDTGLVEDAQSITLGELLSEVDDTPDWIIPGFLERRDRFMLTGIEGLGKSTFLRQLAILAAAGLDPFDPTMVSKAMDPVRVTIIDCENTRNQVKRKVRGLVEFVSRMPHARGQAEMVNLLCHSRMDITKDKDLAEIHRELDATQPDLVVIGPLYRLVPRSISTDDEAAPVLAALDTIRDRGCAILIEAHAGHAIGQGGLRDLRPRGSSALMGWPEFGYGMRGVADGYADLVAWRGQREEREWPYRVRRARDDVPTYRWVPVDYVDREWTG